MESALTPREIQARIRGGESLAEVAQAAGVPVDRVEVYAGPVLAEREHATQLARDAQVRRRGESAAQRHLGVVIIDALALLGIEPEQIGWDAWRGEDRRWTIRVSWPGADDQQQHADFEFDQRKRFSVAADDAARDLIDDHPAPVDKPRDPDSEPTIDLNDELAIVRVLQDDTEPPAVVPDAPSARIIKLPGRQPAPADENEPDDYAEPELEQVDGVYDIIPNPHSDMDVLYDMLAGFNEDSVRIYTGLTQPVAPAVDPEPDAQPDSDAPPAPAPQTPSQQRPASRRRQRRTTRPTLTPAPQPADAPTAEVGEPVPEPVVDSVAQIPPAPVAEAPAEQPEPQPVDEPQQDALVNDPAAKPAPRPAKRRKRAQVPTWDEIMFGGPQPPK